MASIFKSFLASDISSTKTLLSEAIPITGALLTATYGTYPNEENIKNYSHGMWQSVYDYPYLSSSANQIFDITVGYANSSDLSSSTNTQHEKKVNLYGQMAQTLMGFDHTGSVQLFDEDGNVLAGGTKLKECIFINFARLLYKDEIKKGSFVIRIGTGSYDNPNLTTYRQTISDAGAQNDFKVNSPAGEYGILTMSSGLTTLATSAGISGKCGLIFYQAGIAILTASIFTNYVSGGFCDPVIYPTTIGGDNVVMSEASMKWTGGGSVVDLLTGAFVSSSSDALRHRIYDISFSNTTELNSTIYFCRIDPADFNYSSNPSYLSGSKIRVKQNSYDNPVSYISTIGLYSSDNQLLGVAKLSEIIKKDPSISLTFRTRMDY